MTQIVRSPRQASKIFSLDGNHPPRPKNLFYVSFKRGTDTSSGTSSSLGTYSAMAGDLGFLIKTAERPQIQPVVEELNQYNKKRLVHTGVKYSPVRISFYDTTDSLAMQMFADYASNYFGAFGHGNNPNDYLNDILSTFNDTSGSGWGFAPVAAESANVDVNSIYYFRSISIYEVWGDTYTQTDLINPRIIAFDPEGLTYEDSNIATISMSVNYEAVVYVNGGANMNMSDNASIYGASASNPVAAFSTTTPGATFQGENIVIPTDNNVRKNYSDYHFVQGSYQAPAYPFVTYNSPEQSVEDSSYLDTDSVFTDAPLDNYGDYDFGEGFDAFQAGTYASSGPDLLGGVQTSTTIAQAVNAVAAAGELLSGTSGVTIGVPATTFASDQADVVLAAVSALGGYPGGPDTSFYAQKIAAGAMSTRTSLPREKIFTENPKLTSSTNSWDSSTPPQNGVALSSDVYAAINQQRPASAQIGFNYRTLRSQTG